MAVTAKSESTTVSKRSQLSRACDGCIKAKRRCSYDLPACNRCSRAGKTCRYRNVPWKSQDHSAQGKLGGHSTRRWEMSTSCEHNYALPTLALLRLDEPLCPVTTDDATFEYLTRLLRVHVRFFRRHGSTAFIHAKARSSELLEQIRGILITVDNTTKLGQIMHSRSTHSKLISNLTKLSSYLTALLPTMNGYQDLLPFTQAFILLQILCCFYLPQDTSSGSLPNLTQLWHTMLHISSYALWETAPRELPSTLSRHEAYIIAESIRRTVRVAREVLGHYEIWSKGYFTPEMYGACLPFDRRFELWDADEETFDWIAQNTGGGRGSEYLTTYREYCGHMWDNGKISRLDGHFETMVLVGAKSLETVRSRLMINEALIEMD